MIIRTLFLTTVLGTVAHADCAPGEQVFTSCRIEGRNTEVFVCFDADTARYSYGPVGGPAELTLSETIENLEFEPWPGVGRSIWDSVTFRNGEYSYTVVGGVERLLPTENTLDAEIETRPYGGIEIARNDEVLDQLECISETVSYTFGDALYNAKIAAGQDWDSTLRQWVPAAR